MCFGWIDGIRRKRDEKTSSVIDRTAEGATLGKSYKERAAKLIENGEMHAAGQASIDRGKASGLWHFYGRRRRLHSPRGFEDCAKSSPPSINFFRQHKPFQ